MSEAADAATVKVTVKAAAVQIVRINFFLIGILPLFRDIAIFDDPTAMQHRKVRLCADEESV
jgi:hypothetical protein